MLTALVGLAAIVSSCGGGGGGSVSSPTALSNGTGAPALQTGGETAPVLMEAPRAAGKKEVKGRPAEGEIPVLGASGGPSYNDYYVPEKAFDGNYRSWWVGESGAGTWELYYGFKTSIEFTSISVNFFDADHQPAVTTVYVSPNGKTWKEIGTLTPGGPRTINTLKTGMFLRLSMSGSPAVGYPLVRDVDWTPVVENIGAYAAPGYNDDFYFASNALDSEPNSWWVGAINAGEWDFYYGFKEPTMLGAFQVYLYDPTYRPTSMKLLVSNDGITWQDLGELPAGSTPFVYVTEVVSYFRIQMSGNPQSGYPLIKTIKFGNSPGAVAGPNFNDFYVPANAFDGNPATWWAGQQGAAQWEMYYSLPAIKTLNTVTINFYSMNHTPATAALYTSVDGVNWTPAGTAAATLSTTLTVGADAKFVHIVFDGTPVVGYPLVTDITM